MGLCWVGEHDGRSGAPDADRKEKQMLLLLVSGGLCCWSGL